MCNYCADTHGGCWSMHEMTWTTCITRSLNHRWLFLRRSVCRWTPRFSVVSLLTLVTSLSTCPLPARCRSSQQSYLNHCNQAFSRAKCLVWVCVDDGLFLCLPVDLECWYMVRLCAIFTLPSRRSIKSWGLKLGWSWFGCILGSRNPHSQDYIIKHHTHPHEY